MPSAPSPDCDCRQVSIRNVRIICFFAAVVAAIARPLAFSAGTPGEAACSLVIGVAILTYGIVTCFDRSATFSKAVYIAIALVGAALTALWAHQIIA